jgi:V8-like Glu-specific endopeptidase
MFSEGLFSAIGLIRVNWKNSNNEIVSINYGTGFAVNKKLIVTCMHNLYSERLNALASEIIFMPDLDGRSRDDSPIYKCTNKSNIKYMKTNKSFAYSPLKEEVALFKLDDGQ